MNTEPAILDKILKELKASKKKNPSWPVHIAAQGALVASKGSDLMKECLHKKYSKKSASDQNEQLKIIEQEAISTAAICIRFLENLKRENEELKPNPKTDEPGI